MQEKINYKIYLSYFILVIIYILFSLQHSPLFETLGYDKEVFQYIGMIIKNDLHPYSDVFDHKPPVIYLLNYLGVLLTPNSTWGIFLIMNVTGMFSSLLIYKLAYKKLNNIVLSILIAILFIGLINNNVFSLIYRNRHTKENGNSNLYFFIIIISPSSHDRCRSERSKEMVKSLCLSFATN